VIVPGEWPEKWNFNAVVVTPITILGSEKIRSFSIEANISDTTSKILNAYLSISMAQGGGTVSFRQLARATNLSRRSIYNAVKELQALGIIRRGISTFEVDIGSWRPDPVKAKALGIEIKEY